MSDAFTSPLGRAVAGGLKTAIHDHGPITRANLSSAVKRVVGAIQTQEHNMGVDVASLVVSAREPVELPPLIQPRRQRALRLLNAIHYGASVLFWNLIFFGIGVFAGAALMHFGGSP